MADFLSEAVAVRVATETTKGVAPSTGWQEIQPDAGSLSDFGKQYTDVERNTYSKRLMVEPGDHVKKDVAFSIAHDLNKDAADTFLASAFRCAVAHFGGTGVSLFRPTAVTATGFTVSGNGAVPDKVLFYARGFATAANNGLHVSVGSTNTEIKATGLAAETPSGTVSLDLVGFQGADADIGMTAQGHLTSATTDFTTFGIPVGAEIYLPSQAEATAMGSAAYAFANAALTGRARVVAVTANQITLERHTFTPAAEAAAAGKTIRVFVHSRFHRNYQLDDAKYARPTLHAEGEFVDESGAKFYEYVGGCAINTMTIAAPLNSKITATMAFVGMDATDPVTAGERKAGPSSAYEPLATSLIDTQNDLKSVRLLDDSDTSLADEFTEWTLTIDNKVTPKEVQGTFGAAGHKYGKFNYSAAVKAYYSNPDTYAAVTDNLAAYFDAFAKNNDYALTICMPNVRLRQLKRTLAADDIAMLDMTLVAFPHRTDGIGCSVGVFGWLPSA